MGTKIKENNNKDNNNFPLLTVLALILGIFAAGSEELLISPILLDIANSFHSTVDVVGLSVSIYGAAVIIGAPLLAPIGDRISLRANLLIGIMLFLVGTILCAMAKDIIIFFVGRALSGLAAGTFVPTAYTFVGDQIPYKNRGKVMGLIVSSWSLSLILGVPMGSFIGGWFHWRWAFGVLVLFGILVAVLIFIDMLGQSQLNIVMKKETQKQESLVRSFLEAFLTPKVPAIITVTLCNMLGFYGMYTYLGSYLRTVFPLGSSIAGIMIIVYGLGFATSYFSGKFADKFGKRRSLIITMAVLTVILGIIPIITRFISIFVGVLFIWGVMQSLTVTLLSTLLSDCSTKYRGRILAIYSLASNLAVILGAALMGTLYINYGYSKVAIVCAAMTFIGFSISVWIYRRYK